MRRARKSYHEVLGVPIDATPREVKRAYRALAKRLHPDRMDDPDRARACEERLKEVNAAWNEFRELVRAGAARSRQSSPAPPHPRHDDAYEAGYEVPSWRRRGASGSTRDRYRAERVRASRDREQRERDARAEAEAVRRERDAEVRVRVEQDRARAAGILIMVAGLAGAVLLVVLLVALVAVGP